MLHKIFCLLIFGFTVGCMKIKKKDEVKEPLPVAGPALSADQNTSHFDFEYEFNGDIQSVAFKIPSSWPHDILVEKLIGGEKSPLREIIVAQAVWKDVLNINSITSYKFYQKEGVNLKLLEQIDVLPVLDLVIEKNFSIEEIAGSLRFLKKVYIRNLEIKNSAQFLILDFKGLIKIENLVSENGSIQTFATGARAFETNGRSAGGFEIEIQKGYGSLNLNIFGEAGANGKPGAEPNDTLKGADGIEGEEAKFSLVQATCSGNELICIPGTIYNCNKPPKQGGDSEDGKRGFSGQGGFNGGSIEKINVKNLSSTLEVNIAKRAGAKGMGGPGGSGGKPGHPGMGGDGGQRDLLRFLKINPNDPKAHSKMFLAGLGETCPAAPAGNRGSRGDQGFAGTDGQDGVVF